MFGAMFVTFFCVFDGFLIKVAYFYLFVPILIISFTIISSVLTFLVIYLLPFLGFSDQSCFFYLFFFFDSLNIFYGLFSTMFFTFLVLCLLRYSVI